MIRAFYDRKKGSIEGAFTLQKYELGNDAPEIIFHRLVARSGQRSHADIDWVRGKSPIPYGEFFLWLHPLAPGQRAGATGIGEFYQISSGPYKSIIQNPKNPSQIRQDIGLHEENKWPGSAGCIVLVEQAPEVFAYLRELGKTEKSIRLTVL